MGYPLESIAVHGTKTLNRNSGSGMVQSFRVVLKEDGPFNNSQLQQLKDNIKSTNYIGGKLIHDFHGSYGVMGFLPIGWYNGIFIQFTHSLVYIIWYKC